MSQDKEPNLYRIKSLSRIATTLLKVFAKFKFRSFTVKGDFPDIEKSKNRGLIVVSNHPSNAATALLIGVLFREAGRIADINLRKKRYPRALADGRLFHGLRGAIFRAAGQIPVDRSRGADAYKTAEQVLNRGGVIMIYPEGTRTKSLDSWPTPIPRNREIEVKGQSDNAKTEKFYGTGHYKTGAVRLALATGATIIPTLQYLDRAGRGTNALIQFGQPISFANLKGKELSNEELRVRTGQIMCQIAEMMADAKSQTLPEKVRQQILAG